MKNQHEWFDVRTELPEKNVTVLAIGDYPRHVAEARYDGRMWWRSNQGYGFRC